MAAANTQSASTQEKESNKPTHYINVMVVKDGGTATIKLGAIPVYANADKAQRTLLEAIKNGFDIKNLDIMIEVRENVKSTEVDDISTWAVIERNIVEG